VTVAFELDNEIRAPIAVVFDLAASIDLHLTSFAHSNERAIAGVTSGLIGLGEEVTWRAKHFGIWHEHASRIVAFDPPRHFRDEMIAGRFALFVHDHHFEPIPTGTLMIDVLEFRSPLGMLGRAVDRLVLTRYLTTLLRCRNEALQRAAEAPDEGASPACDARDGRSTGPTFPPRPE